MQRVACRTPHGAGTSVCAHETPGLKLPGSRELMLTDYNDDDTNTLQSLDIIGSMQHSAILQGHIIDCTHA